MFNAGTMMNAVAMNIGCSTRAIRHLRQRFQATGRRDDRPRSGRPRLTTRGQSHSSTVTNTHGTDNNNISGQTVCNRLREGARRPDVGCQGFGATSPRKAFFSLTSRGLPFIEVIAGFEYTVGEMNVMPTVAYLNEIVLGVGVLSWSGRALHTTVALISSLLKRI